MGMGEGGRDTGGGRWGAREGGLERGGGIYTVRVQLEFQLYFSPPLTGAVEISTVLVRRGGRVRPSFVL
jgi:hypothetical protein